MKFSLKLGAPSLCLLLLIGCTTSSEVSVPEILPGSAANPQGPNGSGVVSAPGLRADAITRATSTRLERESPAAPEKSTAMDHGGMKMDTAKGSPAAAVSYTCPMHPQIHQPAPGNCPICGMKLVKEKPPTQAH